MNIKERLLSEYSNSLISAGFSAEQVKTAQTALLLCMRDYSVDRMSNALALHDDRSAALIRAFVATCLTEGKSRKTAEQYKFVLTHFAQEVGKPLIEVASIDIRLWIATAEQRVSLTTCENYRAYLSSFYNWMAAEEYITVNPMLKIKPIKCPDKVKLPFNAIEIDALRNACSCTRDRAILEVLLSSGVRVSELCALDISDLDTTSRRLVVRSGKGNKGRSTFISEVAQKYLNAALRERGAQDGSMFVTRYRKRITAAAVQRMLHALGNAAHVDNVHPHRCRRTFATDLAKRGMPVQDIKQLMGHTDINTTMIYCYMDDKQVEYSYKKCG